MKAQKKSRKGCLGAVLGALFAVIVAVAVASSSGGGGAKYAASIQPGGITPVSATTVTVDITVVNVGRSPGKPTCTIKVGTPGGDHGVDALTPARAIAAGAQESYSDTITVTGHAAASVTQTLSSVRCS